MNDQDLNTAPFSNKLNQFIFFALLVAIGISIVFYITPFRSIYSNDKHISKIYFADNISRAHQTIIDRFNMEYEGQIKVIPIDLPFEKFTTNERKELLARSLRSKNSKIDIFAVDQIWVPRFSRWAEPLDKYISKTTVDGIRPELKPTLYHDNKLMAVPLFMDLGVLLYRRDMIDILPESNEIRIQLGNSIGWEELLNIREKYFSGKEFYIFQADNYEGLICNYMEILGARSNPIFENGKFIINSAPNETACNRIRNLVISGASPVEVYNFSENDSYLYAIANDIPFFRAWPSMLANLALLPDSLHFKLDFLELAPLPHENGNAVTSVYGGWNLMVSTAAENKDACLEFIKFCLSDEAQAIMYNEGGFLPVMKSLYNREAGIMNFERLEHLNELISFGVHRPSLVKYSALSDLLSNELHRIITGSIPVEKGLKQAQALVTKELN